MSKTYVGNGKYCYTVNCSRHASIKEFAATPMGAMQTSLDKYVECEKLVERNNPEWGDYYAGTEKKHFSDPYLPGSKFTSPMVNTIEKLLLLTYTQRGSLEGNDVEKFIERGAEPEAFQPTSRYLLVETPGKLGIINSKDLPEDAVLKVERTKPLAPCNYVIEVEHQPVVNYGTVILLDEPEGKTRFITAFPGQPTYVSTSKSNAEKTNSLEGQTFTVAQVRERLGRDITVNTRLISKNY